MRRLPLPPKGQGGSPCRNENKIIFGGGKPAGKDKKMICEERAVEMIKNKNTPAEYLKYMAQSAEACRSTFSAELWKRYTEANDKTLFSGATATDILNWAYHGAPMKPIKKDAVAGF
jgi:hypothetical protein